MLQNTSSGADDDGSGTVTILESYRALLASGFAPGRPVEFHWYSAEVSFTVEATKSETYMIYRGVGPVDHRP